MSMLRNSSPHAHRAGGASRMARIAAAAGLCALAAAPAMAQDLRGSLPSPDGRVITGTPPWPSDMDAGRIDGGGLDASETATRRARAAATTDEIATATVREAAI